MRRHFGFSFLPNNFCESLLILKLYESHTVLHLYFEKIGQVYQKTFLTT